MSLANLRARGYTAREIAMLQGISIHQVRRRLRGETPRERKLRREVPAQWHRSLPSVQPGPVPEVECPRLQKVLRLAVAQLALPVRTINLLEAAGVLTLWELLHCRRAELMALPGLSHHSLGQILAEIKRLDIPEVLILA